MKKKFNWVIKSKHILVIMILVCVSLMVYQIGLLVLGGGFGFWTVVAFALLAVMHFMLFRPDPYKDQKVYSKRSVQAASV